MENIENRESQKEQEQTPEEILRVLTEAIENGWEISLTQKRSDGISIENSAVPSSIEGDCIEIEAGGFGFSILIESITRAEGIEK